MENLKLELQRYSARSTVNLTTVDKDFNSRKPDRK